MAKQATYNSDDHVSESFVPKAPFMVQIIDADPSDYFELQLQPTNIPESTLWLADQRASLLRGNSATVTNGSPGFRYRIKRSSGTGNDAGVEVYWDNVTSLRSVYN